MKINIEKLEKLDREATPGPWEFRRGIDNGDPRGYPWKILSNGIPIYSTETGIMSPDNASLFMDLRNMLPDIIAELKELRLVNEALKISREEIKNG